MAPPRKILDPVRAHIVFEGEDYRYMQQAYPRSGATVAIRALVAKHVRELRRERAREEIGLVDGLKLELGE